LSRVLFVIKESIKIVCYSLFAVRSSLFNLSGYLVNSFEEIKDWHSKNYRLGVEVNEVLRNKRCLRGATGATSSFVLAE